MTEQDRAYIEMTVKAAVSEFKAMVPPIINEAVEIHAKHCVAGKLIIEQLKTLSVKKEDAGKGTDPVERVVDGMAKHWKTMAAAVLLAVSLWRSGGKVSPEEISAIIQKIQVNGQVMDKK